MRLVQPRMSPTAPSRRGYAAPRRLRRGPPAGRGEGTGPPADAAAPDGTEARLLTILQLVNAWLQHAEAKNAGLVALDAAGVAGILGYLASASQLSTVLLGGFVATAFLLVLGLVVALLSFQPRVYPEKLLPKDEKPTDTPDNLYFYGDLQRYRPSQLADAVARLYGGLGEYDASCHRVHTDLSHQIIVNSRITVVKNSHFRAASWLTISAFGTAIGFTMLDVIVSR